MLGFEIIRGVFKSNGGNFARTILIKNYSCAAFRIKNSARKNKPAAAAHAFQQKLGNILFRIKLFVSCRQSLRAYAHKVKKQQGRNFLDIEEISALLLFDLVRICPEALTARYKKLDPKQNIPELLLEGVCRSRGFILSGGVFDTERGARIVLDEYRAGKIAAVALENPTDNFEPQQAEQTDINNEKD